MAATYDFHTLSDIDFEELVRDLLQADWGVKLESFGPGRDQGIDARYLNGPDKIIIQAKHYLGSGFDGLLRTVKKEAAKAIRLQPTRYILATSVSLTPDRKDKIVEAMKGVPLAKNDILGQSELNNLLRKYESIERQNFKLWLSSTAVLERILHSGVYNRTAAEMDIIKEMIPKFVKNKSVSDAEQMLQQNGTLIIEGPPGVGKTTLARMLLWLHAEQGWNIYAVDSLQEALTVADKNEKRLILLDDFLGQVRLSNDHVRSVDTRLPPLLSRIAAHANLRFILTTRDYILAQARELASRLSSDQINAREYVLNVDQYTRGVKAKILYNHLSFSNLSSDQKAAVLSEDFYLKIIDHENFSPRIIERITQSDFLSNAEEPITQVIEDALDNPQVIWERPYRQHIEEAGQALMLALFVNGRSASVKALKASYKRVSESLGINIHPANLEASFRSTFKTLDGSVLGVVHDFAIFVNPGLRDFLQSVVINDNLIPLILPYIETVAEIKELWSVFLSTDPTEAEKSALADKWVEAFDRMKSADFGDRYDRIDMLADFCTEIDYAPFIVRLEHAIDEFESSSMESDEVGAACALLEKTISVTLPWEVEQRFRTVIMQSTAALLIDSANELSFEDIQSLDDALHSYGDDGELATEASHAAMASLEQNLDDEMHHCDNVAELDEFEENLTSFMRSRKYPTLNVAREIDRRRDDLMSEGRMEPEGSYHPVSKKSSHQIEGNDEIRSIFGTLIKD
ncbi:restriction endonuclease [Parasphingorhabdus sp. DH2-15]|uniref:nSTAND3 domain-containing NTPase n=1 Tax=Parasphingorhabdus sp. DH2-15 TaxID=3444112 RepID=UPI003F686F24